VIFYAGPPVVVRQLASHGAPHEKIQSEKVDAAFVGDVMLGRRVRRQIADHGIGYAFAGAIGELKRSDLALGNLECVLGHSPFEVRKRFLLRGDPSQARELKHAGFSGLTLANNHSLDCGKAGLGETLAALRQARIETAGITDTPAVFIRNGIHIAVLGICDFPNESGGTGICYTNESGLRVAIRRAKRTSDVIVVFWHWGVELSTRPSDRQRHLARISAQDGADVVIGCHPHVLQPVAWIHGSKGRRCLVAYSLGNFVFDARPGRESQSEILHVTLTRDGVRGYRTSPYQIVRCRPVRR
jgi:poly-gamma-glutamate capsule biosynthesis protein CapA/YwtB (metallophosphatase superfamily)